MSCQDGAEALTHVVRQAVASRLPLHIRGGNSKAFYGNPTDPECQELDTRCHAGVIDYIPEELMIRVRAGTPLAEVEQLLAEHDQMLPFEPPSFGAAATIGGVVASGLSGPRRPYVGAVRDFVLGITLLTGNGTVLSFGGQVMKNVAGYDVSRVVVGALGSLGVILDVSFKVLPQPVPEETLCLPVEDYRSQLRALGTPAIGLSAHAIIAGKQYVRVRAGAIDGDAEDGKFWQALANHQLPQLQRGQSLWRISVPRSSTQFEDADVIEWGGALRWISDPRENPHAVLQSGHGTLFRTSKQGEIKRFHPLDPVVARIHANLKQQFDPKHIFNPERLNWYAN